MKTEENGFVLSFYFYYLSITFHSMYQVNEVMIISC